MRLFNAYPLVRPFLFRLDPETAHHLALAALKKGFGPRGTAKAKFKANTRSQDEDDSILSTVVCGLDFPNPVGLAAGFDKQCEVMGEVLAFGFGFIEVGTITPLPQPGNPQPRLFRVPEAKAIINRFGFNSDGLAICARRLGAWRDTGAHMRPGLVGINLGKNRESQDAVADYVTGVKAFAPHADYLTVNISSPNTVGLRDLQGRAEMAELLKAVVRAREAVPQKPPLFVKIAPDLTEAQEEDIGAVALETGIEGMIIGNTTISRPANIPSEVAKEPGGLSGQPLARMSTELVGRMYKRLKGRVALVGVGGIASGQDAYAKIRAGASLVQIYTGLIYEGPALVPRIKRDLAALLRRDGFASIGEAVGADHR
ncbi:MAG: quinone-dependent dihydroorotate dehydrogenase [Pseudomonadota bacterium]|nr:quinone-dependent dihydroorotate dehydrogenase [Pseudomonadota bacterium]